VSKKRNALAHVETRHLAASGNPAGMALLEGAEERTLSQNIEATQALVATLTTELHATAVKLERSRAMIDAQLDIMKTCDVLFKKIMRFQEHYVKDE
jgi:hypothetical protein